MQLMNTINHDIIKEFGTVIDALRYSITLEFDTVENNEKFANGFYGQHYITEDDNLILKNYKRMNPHTSLTNEDDYIRNSCNELKDTIAQLKSMPLTGITELRYRMWIRSNTVMLKDEYRDLMPAGNVTYDVEKSLTNMVFVWTHLAELDKNADNIIATL